ncbi:head completion protein [Synechococcus phage S-B68]|nr:head completion protein [Synechococcus phage S-B68]
MPYTNPFFSSTTGYTNEVDLLDDLTMEQIAMYGVDLLFMPRKLVNLDTLLHESPKSAFEYAFPIPMYIKSFDGYDNGMELLTKFGVRSADQITLQMSRTQFTTHYAPFLRTYYETQNGGSPVDPLKGQTDARPKEGDLVYFPFDDGIFEVKYVMFDQPFFQLGKGYIFELQCEKFEYSGETFSTGYEQIDDTAREVDYYRTEFTMQEGGTGTFTIGEPVIIYDVSHLETPTTDVPDPISPFRLYEEAGYLQDVNTITATVTKWNIVDREMSVADLSDLDPTQVDSSTGDVTFNKFDNVLVVGQTSGAAWLTSSASTDEMPFNDEVQIQTEFDQIKIIDATDTNPFGFV